MDSSVVDFIRREVGEWDDEDIAMARFKAFSGQRSDWENKYVFWRDLILKVARHLGIFRISPSQVKKNWFNRGGLTPLCLDDVLFIMYNEGDILRCNDLANPTSGGIYKLFRKAIRWISGSTPLELTLEDHLILVPLLKNKADVVIKHLSENHWTSSCVITMKKFHEICGGSDEAFSVLSYLADCGKAKYLTANKKEFIEGLKISLCSSQCTTSSLDCDVLHLIWTTEKLQQQLDILDRRYVSSRKSALTSLSSGKKKDALRHMRELKLVSVSREKCMSLLNRVEEVLNVIGDAESTKKIWEVILVGARALKGIRIDAEEIELCLRELDECIDSQRQIEDTLGLSAAYPVGEDEDIEEELKQLELEVGDVDTPEVPASSSKFFKETEVEIPQDGDSLSNALSNLEICGEDAKLCSRSDHSMNLKAEPT